MKEEKKLITKKGLKKLKDELQKRMSVNRKDIADRLDEAKAMGDLSENSAYHAALEDYRKNELRIDELKELISSLRVAPNRRGDSKVDIGDKVRIKDIKSDKIIEYEIVGLGEGDPSLGQISSDSKLGSALTGKKVGERVKLDLPIGIKEYEILEVR